MAFRAALFDMDGTLIDSMGVWAEVDEIYFSRRGMAVPADYGLAIAGLSFTQTAEYTKQRFQLPDPIEEILAEWDAIAFDAYVNEVQLKPGAYEYLQKLALGGVRLAVATALPPRLYVPVLKRTGVYDLFSAFASTHETEQSKQTGAVYLLAAQRLQVEPADCVVFEDILNGLIGAHNAGMQAWCVRDDSAKSELSQALAIADRYIDSFTELMDDEIATC